MKNRNKLFFCTLLMSVICTICYAQKAQIILKDSYYFERQPFKLRAESPYNLIAPEYLKNSGDLVFDIEIKNPQGEFFCFYTSMILFLKPGTRLELEYNGRNYFESKFSGDLAAENQWLNAVLINRPFRNRIDVQSVEATVAGYNAHLKNVDKEVVKMRDELRKLTSDTYFIKNCLSRIDFITSIEYFDIFEQMISIKRFSNSFASKEEQAIWEKKYIDSILPLALKNATKRLSKYSEEEIIATYQGCYALGIIANHNKEFLPKKGYHKFNEIYSYANAIMDRTFMLSPAFLDYIKELKDSFIIEHANSFVAENKHLFQSVVSPDFEFADMDGKTHKLSDFKGSVIYIDVWATWCNPCKAISPIFNQLVDEMKDSGIKFLAVSIDSKVDTWKKYIEKNPHSENLHELFANGKNFTDYYNISAIPRFIVIDKEFKIRYAYAPKTFSHTLETIKEMLLKINKE